MVWKHLFNKPADNLERSMENEDECKMFATLNNETNCFNFGSSGLCTLLSFLIFCLLNELAVELYIGIGHWLSLSGQHF